jgi:iron complex outermembrane receptor protein
MELTVLNPVTWDSSKANVGDTHLAFSPELILNNRFTYEIKGFRAALTSKYVGEQYMTNSDFRSYADADGNDISAMIDKMFVSDLDLSYTFKWRGMKSCTVGVTVYNLFNEKYESNGSCAMNFKEKDGKITAFGNDDFWSWSTYSVQAPTHFLAHLSLNF